MSLARPAAQPSLEFMLHISKEGQRERLQARLDEPESRWKFDAADLEDRKLWDEYETVCELMFHRCSTEWAPWHVIPADRKCPQRCGCLHRARDTGSNGPAISKAGLEAERLQSGVRNLIRATA
jgi:polyphosphate kinase 2 (PPK2 family)